MKLVNKITIGIVCLLMILSTIPLPQSVSGETKNGVNGQGGRSGGSTWAELYGYIHLEDETGTTELTGHQIRVTNNRTQYTEQIYTNQYGFYSTLLYDLMYTDILTLEVSYYDPETSNNIYGITNLPVANNLRADPTFRLPLQDCIWYEDINAPPKIPPPHSDLSVGGVYFYDHEQGLEIRFTIWNIGTISASNIEIEVYDGATLLGERYIDHIMPDEYGFNSVIWTAPSEGVNRITVIVDSRNDILEIIETNNEVTVDTDIVIETNGILHFVWENIGDGKIHYLNNYISNHLVPEYELSWTDNIAINPQIEVDSDRVLHVTWIEITSEGYILRYAWSYNQVGTWFDRYELSLSSPEYELDYDAIEDVLTAIVEILGEIIETILNADPNPDPSEPPPSTRGPLDEPPSITITSPLGGQVPDEFDVTGITIKGDNTITAVKVKLGESGVWQAAQDTSEEQDWSSWSYHTPALSDGLWNIFAMVQDDSSPNPLIDTDKVTVTVYSGDPDEVTPFSLFIVQNRIWHNNPGEEGTPNKDYIYPSDGYTPVSPYTIGPNGEPHYYFGLIFYSHHYVQDSDRELPEGVAYVGIRLDSWYDGDPYDGYYGGNDYDAHRMDFNKAYYQMDINRGMEYEYKQTVALSPPEDVSPENPLYYNARVKTLLYYRMQPTHVEGDNYNVDYYWADYDTIWVWGYDAIEVI